jgi:hypothetical protein
MPNRNEIRSLIDYSGYYPAMYKEYFRYFPDVSVSGLIGSYWTSTTLKHCIGGDAFSVGFHDGYESILEKTVKRHIWPVRTMPRFTPIPNPRPIIINPPVQPIKPVSGLNVLSP